MPGEQGVQIPPLTASRVQQALGAGGKQRFDRFRHGQIASAGQNPLPGLKQRCIIAAVRLFGQQIDTAPAVHIEHVSSAAGKILPLPCNRSAAHGAAEAAQVFHRSKETLSLG